MIGILGGTFDPIHFGHLRPALEISEQLSLDELRFIPSANPPHRWQPEASPDQRLEMVKLAVKNIDNFVVDDREYNREGTSYTIDTLASIREEIGSNKPLCMLIGMDAFKHFTTWHNWQGILELAHIVISSRPGTVQVTADDWMKGRVTQSVKILQEAPAGKLFFAEVSQLEISATYIRKQIREGKSSMYTTPVNVSEFIQMKTLYT